MRAGRQPWVKLLGAVQTGLAAACLLFGGVAQAQPGTLEYPVKANYLVRFAAFVEWPPRAFANAQAPVAICVLGRDPFGALLDRAAASQTAYGRRIVVRRPATPSALSACHIAYVAQGTPTAVIDAARAAPSLLLVTDAAVPGRRGIIHFVITDNRVRFHIDQPAATRSGLTISSRLLSLAVSVRGQG